MRVPLIDGQGNFGSVDGDPPAAMRYTEVAPGQDRRTPLLDDIDKDTVDFQANYDGSDREPTVLPAKFPNLLVNGAGGIAVGMATNIPPHNLGEVIDACVALIDDPALGDRRSDQDHAGAGFPDRRHHPRPAGHPRGLSLGRGSIVMRGKVTIEKIRKDREAIVITEIPFQVNKATMVERIAELVREKKIEGISDLRDESDRDGYPRRRRAEARRDGRRGAEPALSLHAAADEFRRQHGGAGRRPAAGDEPEGPADAFIAFREQVVTRRTKFLLNKARDRAHILVGLAIAVANIDEVIRVIRTSPDPNTARETLMARDWPARDVGPMITLIDDPRHRIAADGTARLSLEQAKAILDLRLQRLTALGRDEIAEELDKLAAEIADYLDILRSRARVQAIVKDELREVKARVRHPAQDRDHRAGRRGRGRGPDPARGHGRDRVACRLRQARAAVDLPRAAPRRQGPRRHADARRGFRQPAVRRLDPHAGAVLLLARPGLQGKGLAAADGGAEGARQGADQHPAAGAGRAHHHHHAAARGRDVLGQARHDVRDHRRHRPPQQAVGLRRRPPLRHDRDEAGGGRGDRRRADLHRARRRAADRRRRPVHPLPGHRRARVHGPHLDGRARHRAGRGRQGDLAVDPAPHRGHARTSGRPICAAPRGGGEAAAEETAEPRTRRRRAPSSSASSATWRCRRRSSSC